MHTRFARPRPLQLAAAALLLAVGVAGACAEGTPNTPIAQDAPPAPAAAQPVAPSAARPVASSAAQPVTASSSKRSEAPAAAQSAAPGKSDMVEFRLDEQAKQIPGSGLLRYPASMRTANREGEVHAKFVVDERGLVDMATFTVVKSTDPAFTEAVREALPTMRFRPAMVKGRAVKQLVEQPFTFALSS